MWAEDRHLDFGVRQRLVDVRPGPVGIGDQLAIRPWHFLGNRKVQLSERQLERSALFRLGERQPIETDLDLDDIFDSVLLAVLVLALLHRARSVGGVGMIDADAGAEQLQSAAGAGGLDHQRLHAGALAELFSHGGGEGIDSGGSDDADLVAGRRRAGDKHSGRGHGDRGEQSEGAWRFEWLQSSLLFE